MTEKIIEIEGGEIFASLEDRTITGLLIPYNEIGNTNIGRFMVEAGKIDLPNDPQIVGINTDHERAASVGRATKTWETPDGIMATFSIAKTAEGDAALADAIDPKGKRRRLSGEFHATIKAGKAIAGRLWGAALVERGAFPSAQVLAADTESTSESTYKSTNEDGTETEYKDKTTTTEEFEELEDGRQRITRTTVSISEQPKPEPLRQEDVAATNASATPAEDSPIEGASPVTATAVTTPGALPSEARTPAAMAYDLGTVFASMAQIKGGVDDADARAVLAALSDIKTTGLTNGLAPATWVGQVWQGKRYQRKFIDLLNHGTDISLNGKKGFKLAQGTALVTAWGGNKSEIGSGTASTSSVTSTLRKYGYAADIAREFYDLPGGAEVIQAFVQGVIDSYAEISDLDALKDIVTTAAWNGSGAFGSNITGVIAPVTYPTEYSDALGQLIQGISAVQDAGDTPSFAIVNAAAWNELIYTPKDLIPEYVSFSFATDGTGTADGKVQVVKAPDSGFTLGSDTFLTDPAVVVGAKPAIDFDELGSTPIVLDALDIAKGGIDKAVIAYLQTFIARPESVVLVGVADAG